MRFPRRTRRSATIVATGLAALLVAGCGSDDTGGVAGWPTIHGDARNAGSTSITGSHNLSLAWSRPLGGTLAGSAPVAPNGQIFVGADATGGCNYFSFEMATGRKRFCARIGPGSRAATGAVDTAANVYIGEDGGMLSFNEHGQLRWRTAVMGTPLAGQFTADGHLLFVTQLGQVNVLDRQTGRTVVAPTDLLGHADFLATPNLPWPANDQGLSDCFTGGPECPVATPPALDPASGRIYVTLRPPGSADASLTAVRYADGKISREWTAPVLTGGSATGPALSADGRTVYVTDSANRLIAVDAESGQQKWQFDLGYAPVGGLAVQDGIVIAPGGHLAGIRDRGDHAEMAWQRPELAQAGWPAVAAGHTGYAVVEAGDPGGDLRLVTFDTESGATLDDDPMPGGKGPAGGVSIGPHGEVVAPTAIGELFVFRSGGK